MNKLYNGLEIELLIMLEEDVIRTSFDGYEDAEGDIFYPGESSFD